MSCAIIFAMLVYGDQSMFSNGSLQERNTPSSEEVLVGKGQGTGQLLHDTGDAPKKF